MSQLQFVKAILRQRRFRKLIVLLIWTSLVLGMSVVPFEKLNPQSPIQNYFDALWWTVSTVTTVGYGDIVPITVPGKIIGMILQLTGALMFGAMVAMIGMAVDKSQAEFQWKRTRERFDKIEETLARIEKSNSYLVKKHEDKEKG